MALHLSVHSQVGQVELSRMLRQHGLVRMFLPIDRGTPRAYQLLMVVWLLINISKACLARQA